MKRLREEQSDSNSRQMSNVSAESSSPEASSVPAFPLDYRTLFSSAMTYALELRAYPNEVGKWLSGIEKARRVSDDKMGSIGMQLTEHDRAMYDLASKCLAIPKTQALTDEYIALLSKTMREAVTSGAATLVAASRGGKMGELENARLSDRETVLLAGLVDLLDKLVWQNKKELEKLASGRYQEKEVRLRNFSGLQPLLIVCARGALSRLVGLQRADVLGRALFASCSRPRRRTSGWWILRPRHRQAFAYLIENGAVHVSASDGEKTPKYDEIVRDFAAAQKAGFSPVTKAVADAFAEMHVGFPSMADERYPILAELQARGLKPAQTGVNSVVTLLEHLTACAVIGIRAIDELTSLFEA